MKSAPVILDYRGRNDDRILDEIRELVLNKRSDVDELTALVDSEKFAEKIALFAAITKRYHSIQEKDGYWSVKVIRPACKVVNGSCSCGI